MGRGTLSRHDESSDGSIEFLTPNMGAFGATDVADFVGFDGTDEPVFDAEDEPRSPWLAAMATIVVIGLIGAGVIAAEPWSDDAATATTTIPTSTTRPATTTTERVIDVAAAGPPGFVLDNPSLQLAGAWTVGAGYRPTGSYGDDHFDLWATPDASRTSGQWLAVAARHADPGYGETVAGATRVQVGDQVALVADRGDGVVHVTSTTTDRFTFEVEGFGFALGDLVAIAADLQRGADDTIAYGPVAIPLLAATTQRVSEYVPYGSLGSVVSMWEPRASAYYRGSGYDIGVEVLQGDSSTIEEAIDFLAPAVQLGVADQVAADALARQGRAVTVREVKDWPGALVATWRLPDESVRVQSVGMSVSELLAVAATARLAEPLEWATIIDASERGELQVDMPAQAQPTRIDGAMDAGFKIYSMEMVAGSPAMVFINGPRTGWGGPIGEVGTEPTVRQFSSPDITFLVLTSEWPSTIRSARITVEGREPVELTMVQVGDSPVYASGFWYTETGPVTVEFLTDDGTVVAMPA